MHESLQVYEEIAGHFSDTRHSPWPKVLDFVDAIPRGGLLIDVGCGNGKYMGRNSTVAKVSQLFPFSYKAEWIQPPEWHLDSRFLDWM